MFLPESYWRDVLAFNWRIRTVRGAGEIASEPGSFSKARTPKGFGLDRERTAPRFVTRAGSSCIEAIFRFETADGPASGAVRMEPDFRRTARLDLSYGARMGRSNATACCVVG